MKVKLLLVISAIFSFGFQKQNLDGREIKKKMYDRYSTKWYRTFTFNQTTEVYRNDTLRHTETWYEAVMFPDKFRIDFGPTDSGNAVIYKGDSVSIFRQGKLRGVRKDDNDLTFILGGMYFMPFDQVLEKIKGYNYDVTKSHEDMWKGKPVYVVGANMGEDTLNQLWIDKQNLYVVRMLTFNDNRKEEGLFEDQISLGGGWTETKVHFYINNKLIQVETYHDCKAGMDLDPRVFEASEFGKVYWQKK